MNFAVDLLKLKLKLLACCKSASDKEEVDQAMVDKDTFLALERRFGSGARRRLS